MPLSRWTAALPLWAVLVSSEVLMTLAYLRASPKGHPESYVR
jgi:hypothetical protein